MLYCIKIFASISNQYLFYINKQKYISPWELLDLILRSNKGIFNYRKRIRSYKSPDVGILTCVGFQMKRGGAFFFTPDKRFNWVCNTFCKIWLNKSSPPPPHLNPVHATGWWVAELSISEIRKYLKLSQMFAFTENQWMRSQSSFNLKHFLRRKQSWNLIFISQKKINYSSK